MGPRGGVECALDSLQEEEGGRDGGMYLGARLRLGRFFQRRHSAMSERMSRVFVCVLAGAACLALLGAGPHDKLRAAEQIEKHIETLRAKAEELEAQEAETEERARKLRELAEILEECRERLRDYDEEAKELAEEEEPPAGAWRNLVEARKKHISACRAIDRQILSLKEPDSLPEARKLMVEHELLVAQWDILLGPKYRRAGELEEMRDRAAETNLPFLHEILTKIEKLHQEDIARAEKELALRKARIQAGRLMEQLMEQFWAAP